MLYQCIVLSSPALLCRAIYARKQGRKILGHGVVNGSLSFDPLETDLLSG